jgi:hypothetical protein
MALGLVGLACGSQTSVASPGSPAPSTSAAQDTRDRSPRTLSLSDVEDFTSAENTLFPGDAQPGCTTTCEFALKGPQLFVPYTHGDPWGDTYQRGRADLNVAAGFSSGRIALLRRLALLPNGQRVALLLDPSWSDGARNFAGTVTTGPDIVLAWLRGKASRRFVLMYSAQSLGWREYADLKTSDVGAQVRVCNLGPIQHERVPTSIPIEAIVHADTWQSKSCSWGR